MREQKLKYATAAMIVAVTVSAGTVALIRTTSFGRSEPDRRSLRPVTAVLEEGRHIFEQKCAACHYSDRQETKMGPGLKGIFQKKELPVSKREVNEENVRRQLREPYSNMPSFRNLEPDQVTALIAFLRTL